MPNSRICISDKNFEIKNLKFNTFYRNHKINDNYYNYLNQSFSKYLLRFSNCNSNMTVSLSGGLDSRIAAFAANKLGLQLQTWSSGQIGSLECRVAKEVSKQLNVEHQNYEYDGSQFVEWIENAIWITEGRVPPGHIHFLEAGINRKYCGSLQLHGLIGDVVIGGDYDDLIINKNGSPFINSCEQSMKSLIYWPDRTLNKIVCKDINYEIESSDKRTKNFIFDKISFSDTYSDYLWFRYYFRGFGFIIPCLVSQILPWADPIFPYIDNRFFDLCAQLRTEDIVNRKTQIEWAKRFFPDIAKIPRIKDGVSIKFNDPLESKYEKKIKRLNLKNQIKYYLCRLSSGRINFQRRETYPYYDQWYRKWPSIRRYYDKVLLSERFLNRGLFDADTTINLLNNIKIGKNVWNAVATLLFIEVFIRQFIEHEPPY